MARLAYTSILIALVATCVSAQAQQQRGSAAQIMSTIPANSETITHWYKQSVYDPKDNKIGEIKDVLVDHKNGQVTSVIIGARTPAQLEDNLNALKWDLTPDEIARLDALSEPPRLYPYWMIAQFHANR